MGSVDLDRYVRRCAAICETCPPASRSEVFTWLLWPLLNELGWDRGAARSGETVGLLESDLVLSVPSEPPTPALLVAAEATGDQLSDDRIGTIASAMAHTGIDRALYANGREFLIFAGPGDDRLRISAADLPSRAGDVALFARESLRTHCEDLDPAGRSSRRLAVFRDELADSVATLLETKLGSAGSPGDRAVSDFLDVVGGTVGSAEPAAADDEASADTSSSSVGSTASDRSGGETPGSPDGEAGGSDDGTSSLPQSVPPAVDPEGEYVVRIFNERGSIGAVGHSTSAGALAEAASYFFERGLSGIRVPWAPEDGPIVINEVPVDDAGARWGAFEQLSNGLYVNTDGSVGERASRVEALAGRAGLRVMLSGDWSGATR